MSDLLLISSMLGTGLFTSYVWRLVFSDFTSSVSEMCNKLLSKIKKEYLHYKTFTSYARLLKYVMSSVLTGVHGAFW